VVSADAPGLYGGYGNSVKRRRSSAPKETLIQRRQQVHSGERGGPKGLVRASFNRCPRRSRCGFETNRKASCCGSRSHRNALAGMPAEIRVTTCQLSRLLRASLRCAHISLMLALPQLIVVAVVVAVWAADTRTHPVPLPF